MRNKKLIKRRLMLALVFCVVIALTGTSVAVTAGVDSSLPVKTGTALTEQANAAVTEDTAITVRAQEILAGMTTKEKIAQMLVVPMPVNTAVKTQKKYQFGGYILFLDNFKNSTKTKLRKQLRKCQKVSDNNMLIAVDEEGGTVIRASYYSQFRNHRFRSPRAVYQASGYSGIVTDTRKKDKFLKSLGINCNFAPVADVPYESSDFMYDRAFSTNYRKTKKFIARTVRQMDQDNVVSVLKHFPGYGGNGDTHGQIIRDKRKLKTFKTRDLIPFQKGIDNGADMIMVSHTIVNAFDPSRPASISPKVHKYMRNTMGFNGVVITDGLAMYGLRDFTDGSVGKAAVRAVKAGNDMLCVTDKYTSVRKALKKAVKNGSIDKSQIDASVQRILEMKIRRGIIKQTSVE